MNKQVVSIQGTQYIIERVVNASAMTKPNDETIKEWCDMLHCERVFKRENKYYFVNQITDIDYEQIT